jgi:ribosomal protein L10
MPVTKARKKEQVEKLSADLKNVSSAVVATYSKMTVAQDYELRKALRGAGAKYQVVKNTLAELAAKGTKIEEGLKNLSGVTSIAYTTGDPVAMAKALTKYAKVEGRDLLQAVVPDQLAGATAGDGDECRGARCGSGAGAGRGEGQVRGELSDFAIW